MLVLTLKTTNTIRIGSAIIRIADTERGVEKVRIAIEAPPHIIISRGDAQDKPQGGRDA